jgi:hypothetical protein
MEISVAQAAPHPVSAEQGRRHEANDPLMLFSFKQNMNDQPKQGIFSRASITVDFLRRDLPVQLQHPKVAVVCGSGLGRLANELEADPRVVVVPYSEIPGFPVSTGM